MTEIYLCADCPGEKLTQEEWVEHTNRHAREQGLSDAAIMWLEEHGGEG